MGRFSTVLTKRPVTISLIFFIVMVVMISGVVKMKLATGNDTLMNTNSMVYKDNLKLEKYFGGESIVILNTSQQSNGILTTKNIQRMEHLGKLLNESDNVFSFVSPASMATQKMNGLILDDKHSVMIVKLKGGIDDQEKNKVINVIEDQLNRFPFDETNSIITGQPMLDSAVHKDMQKSMKRMIGIAVVLMLVVLTIVFHVRWRVIAIPVILLSVFATLGLMGYVGVPMTMVSMAVFPILIGLGVDYAIQFQNRYEEESDVANNLSAESALRKTLKHMVPAVGTAILASVLGFTALYVSPVPMVQDFGKMLTIGVIISFISSIFFLMSILFIRDRYSPAGSHKKRKSSKGTFEKAMAALTKGTLKIGPIILITAFLLTGLGMYGDTKVGVQTDVENFMPQNTPELHDIHTLRQVAGTTDQVIVLYEAKNVLDDSVIHWVDRNSMDLLKQFPNMIVSTESITTLLKTMNKGALPNDQLMQKQIKIIPQDQAKLFLTGDHRHGVILLGVKHLESADMKNFIQQLQQNVDRNLAPGVQVTITGKSVLNTAMVSALTTGRYEMTFWGIGLVFLILLLIYRHLIKAMVAIVPIGLIIGWSGGLMYILGYEYTPLTATLGALVIGIGTEFTILIMERFYEERRKGTERTQAVVVAVQKIGKAILASGLTVIGGFSALIISDFVILSNFGIMTVINMALCLISTLIVLPPTLVLLDRLVKTKANTCYNDGEVF